MASQLAKIFDFQANIPVTSLDPLDAEFQQIIDVLNGTSTGTKLLVKTSDAVQPPIENDQVGAGPLAAWKQNGTLKVAILNSGQVDSSVATGTAPINVDSTTVCPNLNADLLDGSHASDFHAVTKKTFFAIGWGIEDPSTYPLQSFSGNPKVRLPGASGTFTATALVLTYATGTASGQFQIHVEVHDPNAQGSPTTLATINVNSGTVGLEQSELIDDVEIGGKYVVLVMDSRSSPAQRSVSVTLHGEQVLH